MSGAVSRVSRVDLRTGKRLKKVVKRRKILHRRPFSMMVEKGPTLAKLLEREGCVGVPEARAPETGRHAPSAKAFVEDRRGTWPWPRSKRAARPSSRASGA